MSYVKINRKPCRFRLVQTKTSYVTARCFKMKSNFNGNAQFLFLCNPQKSSVNAFLMKIIKKHCHTRKWVYVFITLVKKTLKSSSFCNISNFHNAFVWCPSKVQSSVFEWIACFLQEKTWCLFKCNNKDS